MWIKSLKETSLGVARASFDSEKYYWKPFDGMGSISKKRARSSTPDVRDRRKSSSTQNDILTAKNISDSS